MLNSSSTLGENILCLQLREKINALSIRVGARDCNPPSLGDTSGRACSNKALRVEAKASESTYGAWFEVPQTTQSPAKWDERELDVHAHLKKAGSSQMRLRLVTTPVEKRHRSAEIARGDCFLVGWLQ